jgi:aminoglycoside phosphotransferase (APT) family kinase protein
MLLPRAHDMHREYRVLDALRPTPVPVPHVLAYCDDAEVIGAPFYLMDELDGRVIRSVDDAAALAERERAALSDAVVDVLADLHGVDPEEVGLTDYGRWGGYATRQIRTWGEQWTRSRTRELPDMDRLLERLSGADPGDDETTIVHGDYRLDNTMVQLEPEPAVVGVLDWELSTLGHPVADLATMLTYWHDRGDEERGMVSVAAGLSALPGFHTTDQLAQRYADRTGRDLRAVSFYLALAAMKLAAILEGVHARFLGGKSVGDGYDRVGDAVPVLAARGLRQLAG